MGVILFCFFFFKQKTAYEIYQCDWSSDVCSSDLAPESALTGPLTRNDQETIERNIHSLDGDPLQDLYRAFVRFYQSNERQGLMPEQAQRKQIV